LNNTTDYCLLFTEIVGWLLSVLRRLVCILAKPTPLTSFPRFTKHPSGLGQSPANCGFTAICDSGHIGRAKAFKVPQDENRPVRFRNLRQHHLHFLSEIEVASWVSHLRIRHTVTG
jgi:hypothetical protein